MSIFNQTMTMPKQKKADFPTSFLCIDIKIYFLINLMVSDAFSPKTFTK